MRLLLQSIFGSGSGSGSTSAFYSNRPLSCGKVLGKELGSDHHHLALVGYRALVYLFSLPWIYMRYRRKAKHRRQVKKMRPGPVQASHTSSRG